MAAGHWGRFQCQFDIDHGEDDIGWDGHYGAILTGAPRRDLAFKLGLQHTSGHVGDEYAERTGRKRLGYTRVELVPGISWNVARGWRTYAEYGWGYGFGNTELQKKSRVQGGVEFDYPLFRQERLNWFAAYDASTMQERNWRLDSMLLAGLSSHSAAGTWRVGIQYHDGRPTISEFFQETEKYWSLGLWIDL